MDTTSASDLLKYLEKRLHLIRTIPPEEVYLQFELDPLAEYLAGMKVVEEKRGIKRAWEQFFDDAAKMSGAPESIRGFLLAVLDCCHGKVPGFVREKLGTLLAVTDGSTL